MDTLGIVERDYAGNYQVSKDFHERARLAPVEDERFSELAYKFAEVYWQRVPFLEDMEHELWMHRAGVEEWLRQKEEYMTITDDARASDASF